MKSTALSQPQLSATPWTDAAQPCPPLIGFPSRENFPSDLIWSGTGELPAVGQRVRIFLNNVGEAEVKGYFHFDGYLGVLVAPDKMPAHLAGLSLCHAYGIDLEARRLRLSTPPTPADVSTDWIPDYPDTATAA